VIEVREHSQWLSIDSIDSIDSIGMSPFVCAGFEWSPSNHRLVAHRYRTFTSNVIELMMIRGMLDASPSSITPWLPNELMFEIFRALFDAYHCQL